FQFRLSLCRRSLLSLLVSSTFSPLWFLFFFFFNDTATTEISTLSLHDALPIYRFSHIRRRQRVLCARCARARARVLARRCHRGRSEEHTSELQSLTNLVCRLLLEKKKNTVCATDTPVP